MRNLTDYVDVCDNSHRVCVTFYCFSIPAFFMFLKSKPRKKKMSIPLLGGGSVKWKYDANVYAYSLNWEKRASTAGCGNPWNALTKEEFEKIRALKPDNPKPPCGINHKVAWSLLATEPELQKEMDQALGADCWGLYTIREDGKEKVYFSHRTTECTDTEPCREEGCWRTDFLAHPEKLVRLVKENKTVVLVMGGDDFIEIYFSALPSGFLMIENYTF